MNFKKTPLDGVWVISTEEIHDERGFFLTSWCKNDFTDHGLEMVVDQCNVSYNQKAGTLRGLHFQEGPFAQTKLVTCITGKIFDVAVDLRPGSPTYLNWFGIELSEEKWEWLYIPKGFAHGFQTLMDNTKVLYQMETIYHPESARDLLWSDPTFGIQWPLVPTAMSQKDREASVFGR